MVKVLNLRTQPCSSFSITVANGEKLSCEASVNEVNWTKADKLFTYQMNVIPLGGYDMILGVHLMAQVCPVTFDYVDESIKIH